MKNLFYFQNVNKPCIVLLELDGVVFNQKIDSVQVPLTITVVIINILFFLYVKTKKHIVFSVQKTVSINNTTNSIIGTTIRKYL